MFGCPGDWFAAHGWRVVEATDGSNWDSVTRAMLEDCAADVLEPLPDLSSAILLTDDHAPIEMMRFGNSSMP